MKNGKHYIPTIFGGSLKFNLLTHTFMLTIDS
jgi:hypothetical protein